MSQKVEYFPLGGGLDLETASVLKNPGTLISVKNFEPSNISGYSRIDGYERFDGRPSPDDAVYHILNFDAGTNEPSVNDSVLGGTSGATGKILAVVLESGTWAGNDAVGYIVINKLTGTWADDENIRDNGDTLTHAVANGTTNQNDATTFALNETYLKASREDYRADIGTVTGSGDIRGVWLYSGSVYAFRDNAGATACQMWKSSTSGWVLQDLGETITFSTGTTAAPTLGVTVTGGTSGATGVVVGIQITSGTFSGNDAVGYLSLKTVSGTWTGGETITYSGGSIVETANSANTLTAGGKYEFINYNFQGQSYQKKMYGCNGLDKAFQWDGTGFAWIVTGASTDTPDHIFAHSNHLFAAVDSSILHSGIGAPLDWSVLAGAAEIATGDSVVGFVSLPDEAAGVFCRNITYVLYGTSSADWELRQLAKETGAIEWSIQDMGTTPKYLDDRGIVTLQSVQEYGNFTAAVLSERIEPYVQSKKPLINTSIRVREKNQYRLFFSDNTAIFMRTVGNSEAFTLVEYDHEVVCCCSLEDSSGNERMFFGSTDGYIYEMDKGDSFDGENIESAMKLAFNNLKSPRNKKRFFKIIVDVDYTEVPSLDFTPDFTYGSLDTPMALTASDNTLIETGADYDTFSNWGTFAWDGAYQNQAVADIDGSGTNISLLITNDDNYGSSFRIHGVYLHYGLRGLKRG